MIIDDSVSEATGEMVTNGSISEVTGNTIIDGSVEEVTDEMIIVSTKHLKRLHSLFCSSSPL